MAKTKILYILGNGRSGSTILGNILNEVDGFFTAGELRQMWQVSLRKEAPCACGNYVDTCEVWAPIIKTAFGGIDQVDTEQMVTTYNKYAKNHNIPLIALPNGKKRLAQNMQAYLVNLEKLYQAIATETGSRVIVDTSKHSSYSAVVDLLKNSEVYVVHLIRDPRAVAYSWSSKKFKPDEGKYMAQLPTYLSALRWLTWNLGGLVLWNRRKSHYLQVHYEDFVHEPRATVEAIIQFVGEPHAELPFTSKDEVLLSPNHIVFGNPNRMSSVGTVQVKYDARWKTKMKLRDKAIVMLITLPLLTWFQYLFGKRS